MAVSRRLAEIPRLADRSWSPEQLQVANKNLFLNNLVEAVSFRAMVLLSCSSKFHAFNLAEQLDMHGFLDTFFTTYAYQKNTLARKFISRVDLEKISNNRLNTNLFLASLHKCLPDKYQTNNMFDNSVARKIRRKTEGRVFIGWSGMSLHAIREAKKQGMITIVERGSSHICFQNKILKEEYKNFGQDFSIDERVIEKELNEYNESDYISVPSNFVRKTFKDYGIDENRLVVNPYGVSGYFNQTNSNEKKEKFIIVYLGKLSIRKGLKYLFEALHKVNISSSEYEMHFVGHVDDDLKDEIARLQKGNWKFFGHINHYQLSTILSNADVAVHPSIEEGLSMVIPQLLSCGVPVIATTNTGGEDIIADNLNGFIVPVRSPEAIAAKIELLFNNPEKLGKMKREACKIIHQGFTWNDYGNRYTNFLKSLISK